MKIQFNMVKKSAFAIVSALLLFGCQNLDRPELGDYAVDANPPGGSLKFYVNFDATTTDPLRFAVDQIRANFPTDNPFTQTSGVTGKAVQGVNDKFINYAKPNDWATTAKSFSVAFWEKHNGQTINGTNPGGEHIFSLPSTNGHWSSSMMFLLFDAAPTKTATAIKFTVNLSTTDNWFTWEGGNSVEGLLDNQWHHCAFVYDATTSKMTFYKDGVANAITPQWGSHGNVGLDNSQISGLRIGGGPQPQIPSGDNWLTSSWKGSLDGFRLYSTALTQVEVMDLYTNKK